jgi:hypothetical protein
MKATRDNDIPQRNRDLFEEYNKVLAKYGKLARLLPRSLIYEEVASKFYLTPRTAGSIINRMIKNSSTLINSN